MLKVTMRRLGVLVLAVLLVAGLLPAGVVSAGTVSCTATVPTTVLVPSFSTELSFVVTNGSGTDLAWFEIRRPNADYVVESMSVDGWNTGGDADRTIFNGATLASGQSTTVHLWVHSSVWESAPASWVVQASDNSEGSGAVACGGSRTTSVHVDLSAGVEGQGISSITVDPTASSAIIQWQSDALTGSAVSYGETGSYGLGGAYDETATTNHQVVIRGLKAGTAYHFRVEGVDDTGVPWYSADNTFLTLGGTGGTKPAPTPVASGLPTARGTIPVKATPTEKVAPVVAVTTNLTKPFTRMPVINGTVSDNVAVARVDYSLDGGKNWIVVPDPPGLGTKSVRFTVTTSRLEDGNYSFMVRGTDTSGNTAQTAPTTLVVDLLPPRIGTEFVSMGSQAAVLDEAGRYDMAAGADQTVTMNAVGGPITITIAATRDGAGRPAQQFHLRQDPDSGLWAGVLAFSNAGLYHLAATAVDGAGNQTSRSLSDVMVGAPARVVDKAGQGVGDANITLYQRDADSGVWAPWGAEAYGQTNPQITRSNGNFAALLPAGTYYMKVSAAGYETIITKTFTLDRVTPLQSRIELAARPRLTLGSWSWTLPGLTLGRAAVTSRAQDSVVAGASSSLVGRSLPRFSLPSTAGATVTPVGLQGKPTVMTVLSTWSPATSAQMSELSAVPARAKAVQVVPVYVGEHVGKVKATMDAAGYTIPAVVDAQAVLGDSLGAPVVPTHYFVDRTGTVRSVYAGLLSTDQILSRLAGL